MQSYNPGVLRWDFLRLMLRLHLGSLSRGIPSSHLEKKRKINSRTHMYLFMKASRVVLRGVWFREKPLTQYVRNSLGNQIWSIYNAKYSEMWTFYTPCVSVAVSGDFCHETARKCTNSWNVHVSLLSFFAMNATPARQVTPPLDVYMGNCHPGWQGYPTWQTG